MKNAGGNALPRQKLGRAQSRFVFCCLAPVMVLFVVFLLAPIAISVVLSFFNYSPLSDKAVFVGLKYYSYMLTDPNFIKTIVNTLVFVASAVAINLVLSTSIALMIYSLTSTRLREMFRAFYFLPVIAPLVGASLVFKNMFDPQYGLVSMVMERLGSEFSIYWLSDARYALIAVIIVTLWHDLGYNIVILTTGLYSIPKTYFESGKIDGANRWQLFWNITLPLLSRTMAFVSVMTIISYFQVFTQVQIMTRGGPSYATQLIAVSIYQNAFEFERMGYASAMAVVLLVLILCVSLIQMKLNQSDWEY